MKKLNVGVIGLGTVAEAHLLAYQNVGNVKVVALAELRKERLDQFVQQYGYRGYLDYNEMLEKEELDIVCVLVPASFHRKVVEDVAKHKIHILCEKPIAVTLEDAKAMAEICRVNNVEFYYAASYRHMPTILKAKAMIDQGKLGKITYISERMIGGSGRANYKELNAHHYPTGGPGGAGLGLMDHGIHLIDLFNWFSGSHVESLVGHGNYSGGEPQTEYLLLHYANGTLGELVYNAATFPSDLPGEGIFSFGATWDIHDKLHLDGKWDAHPINIRVHGEKGALRIFPYANQLFFFTDDGVIPIPVSNLHSPAQFGLELESFATSLLKGEKSNCSFATGIEALKIALAAYESFQTQRYIHLVP